MPPKPTYEELDQRVRELERATIEGHVDLSPDLTAGKRAQEATDQGLRRYEKLFRDSPVPLWEEDFSDVIDYLEQLKAQGVRNFRSYFDKNPGELKVCARKVKILDVNQATLELHQAKNKADLLGNLDKRFSEISFDIFKNEMIALAAGELEYEAEGEVKTLTGESRHVLLRLTIDKQAQGVSIGLLATTDITQKRKLEEELRRAHKMEAIGTLAGGIAHDFNNILTAILGFTELALDDVDQGSHIADNLQAVLAAGGRAGELVKQILTFARQTEVEIKPIQVSSIAKETIKFLRSSIPTTIDIQSTIASKSLIMGNPTHIHQIFMNLCTNSAHAMQEAGGRLHIGLKDVHIDRTKAFSDLDLRPGRYLEIRVSDTGVGIPTDKVDAIFEPYYTTKPIGEGTGMGLAVIHGIVESYEGKIKVDSTPGQGTTIRIYLSIVETRLPRKFRPPSDLPSGTEHILFVDDEAPITRLGTQILKRLGYSVTSRTSSLEALELFRSKPRAFDLVITDMTMPNMTGETLAAEMLKIRSDIPVILCTGYSKKIFEQRLSDVGIKAIAYKPLVKADLAKAVRKALDDTR